MANVTRVEGKRGVTYRIDYIDPKGKRIRRMFKKKKEASAELAKRVSLMAEGRYLDVKKDTKVTLGSYSTGTRWTARNRSPFIPTSGSGYRGL